MVVCVDFLLGSLKNFVINVFVDRNSALFVDRLGEIVALGMVIFITKAFINSNPTICRRKEGRGIDSNDA